MTYKIQYNYYCDGEDWKNFNELEYFKDLDAIEEAYEAMLNDNKSCYRVVDEDGLVVADYKRPYEKPVVDILGQGWLKEIQRDYGITDFQFAIGVHQWLGEFLTRSKP